MRALLALLLITFTSSCVVGGKHAINVYGGKRSYDGDIENLDSPPVFGLEGMVGITSDGLSVEGGYAYAEDSDAGAKLATNELYIGARKTFNSSGLVQPYIGLGVDWLNGDGENDDPMVPDISDDGIGAYARAGVGFQIAIFQAGLDLRGVLSSVEIGDERLSFVQGAVFIGVSL